MVPVNLDSSIELLESRFHLWDARLRLLGPVKLAHHFGSLILDMWRQEVVSGTHTFPGHQSGRLISHPCYTIILCVLTRIINFDIITVFWWLGLATIQQLDLVKSQWLQEVPVMMNISISPCNFLAYLSAYYEPWDFIWQLVKYFTLPWYLWFYLDLVIHLSPFQCCFCSSLGITPFGYADNMISTIFGR